MLLRRESLEDETSSPYDESATSSTSTCTSAGAATGGDPCAGDPAILSEFVRNVLWGDGKRSGNGKRREIVGQVGEGKAVPAVGWETTTTYI